MSFNSRNHSIDTNVTGNNRRILQKAPLAIQRRVIRQILQAILSASPNFEHIEKLTGLITAPNRSQTDPFPGGAIAIVQDDWICFHPDQKKDFLFGLVFLLF